MNVAGYVRVSSESQVENYSIPQQKEAITNYCKAKGWDLIKIYVDALTGDVCFYEYLKDV